MLSVAIRGSIPTAMPVRARNQRFFGGLRAQHSKGLGPAKRSAQPPYLSSQALIMRAPVTAISRRKPGRPAKEGNMVLERRCPLLLVGPIARRDFIAADDAVFDLIDAYQTSKLVWFMRLAFADHDAVGFEQAQYLFLENGSESGKPVPEFARSPARPAADSGADSWRSTRDTASGRALSSPRESLARTARACEVTPRVSVSKRP